MRKPNPPKLVTVALTTTITIIFWIFFTLYRILSTSPKPSVDEKLLEPIVPELNSAALEGIKERIFVEEGSFTMFNTSGVRNNQPVISEVQSQPEENESEGAPTPAPTVGQIPPDGQ